MRETSSTSRCLSSACIARTAPRVSSAPPRRARERELLCLAAVELGSEHPLGAAIVKAAREDDITLPEATEVRADPGRGIRGRVENREVRVGRRDFVVAADDAVNPGLHERALARESEALTVVWLSVDGEIRGALAIGDSLRPEATAALQALHARGLRIIMLTGDNARAAGAIAEKLDIDEVHAELLPGAKADAIEAIRASHSQRGALVAMVGDGINDAPALAAADVGVAMGSGTNVAIETADVTLVGGQLERLPRLIDLSRRTMRTIKQNLFAAFVYNLVAIPIAAGALYHLTFLPSPLRALHPGFAAAAMALSSISVLGNSLRLERAMKPRARDEEVLGLKR